MAAVEFEREGKRKRAHVSLSAELIEVLELLDDEGEIESRSRAVESAVWADLVDQHGPQGVLELIDQAQDEIGPDDRLVSSVREEIAT